MMKTLVSAMCLCMTVSALAADGWQQGEDNVFTLSCPRGKITFDGKNGNVKMLAAKGPSIEYGFFLWHDAWIYELLGNGKVVSCGIEGKALVMSGTWGTRDEIPPMQYTLTAEPRENGVTLKMALTKPEQLNLCKGVCLWGHIGPSQEDYYLDSEFGIVDILHEVSEGSNRLMNIGAIGSIGVRVESGKRDWIRFQHAQNSHRLEWRLFGEYDFDDKDKAVNTLEFSFADMPKNIVKPVLTCQEPLSLSATAPDNALQYRKIELDVKLRGTWDNPYDPDDISLDAEVVEEDGRRYTLPGFFMLTKQIVNDHGDEVVLPGGETAWKVRLTALKPGALRVTLHAKDRNNTISYALPKPIVVSASNDRGFVRESKIDPHYFAHDNGEPYKPIGHNIPLYLNGKFGGLKGLDLMVKSGENWNRWWLSSNGLGLEWERKLGWYRQKQAALLDFMLDTDDFDIYYMICMDTHQDFRESGWKNNPYNAVNGGPCQAAVDWFTNETAKKLYRNRLRYIVARWAFSRRVMCWEFGNEFEGWAGCPQKTIIEWHREMAPYLANLDPYDHLISTSWWSHTGPEECWNIPEMGILQTHCYTNNNFNVAPQIMEYCREQWNRRQKPHIFAEFGIRSHNFRPEADKEGWGVHNAAWAAVMSGSTCNPMPWWHENYIAPYGLGFHFQALRNYVTDVPFGLEKFSPLECSVGLLPRQPALADETQAILPTRHLFEKSPVEVFHISDDGTCKELDYLASPLQGNGHQNIRSFPTFEAEFFADGVFSFKVTTVSKSALLRIYVDDQKVFEKDYQTGENHGKSWIYREQWNLWESTYDEEVSISVKKGKHLIRLENHGEDWVKIPEYVLTNVRKYRQPTAVVAGMKCDSMAILWLQNGDSTWYRHANLTVPVLPPVEVSVKLPQDGEYDVEWWETWKGTLLKTTKEHSADGVMKLTFLALQNDIALKIRLKK